MTRGAASIVMCAAAALGVADSACAVVSHPATADSRVETEVRTIAEELIRDSASRRGLRRDTGAGWDGHPFLTSSDGSFRLEFEGRFQIRYVFNTVDEATDADDQTESGFEARRVRTIFSGHVGDPSLTYKVQSTFRRDGGALRLEDAFISKRLENGVYLRIGQFRPPLTREANVSTFRMTAVERSIAHGAIELTRSQGIEIGWRGDRMSLRGSFNDGQGAANSVALSEESDWAFSARAEFRAAGAWRRFRDFTSPRGEQTALLFGAGAGVQRDDDGTDEADEYRWTIDASAEFDGAHLYTMFGQVRTDAPGHGESVVSVAVGQGGVFVTDSLELFGRIEWGDDGSADDLLLATIGATKFWHGHALKWTTDVGYAFDRVTDTFASGGAGWRADTDGSSGQTVVRTQIQLMF